MAYMIPADVELKGVLSDAIKDKIVLGISPR